MSRSGESGLSTLALSALLLASAQAPLNSTLIAVALPSVAEGLGVDAVATSTLLVASYLVVTVLFQGPGGLFSDAFGHTRTLRLGMALFAAGSLAGLVSPTVWILAGARAVTAIGGALVVPATLALMRLHVPPERRGRAFGLFGAVMATSAAVGPVLGGELVVLLGWRSVFVASLPFLALAALLLRLHPLPVRPPSPASAGTGLDWRGLDWLGLALLALTLVALVAGGRTAGALRAPLLLAGIGLGLIFGLRQWRGERPILDLRMLAIPAMAGGASIQALQNFAMYGLMFQLPIFFEHLKGAAPREVGYGLSVMMAGMVAASPLGGRATDRLGARRTALLGGAVLLAGCAGLAKLDLFASPYGAMPFLLLVGVGLGLSSAPAQSSAMAAVPGPKAGAAAGLSSTLRYLGGISTVIAQGVVLGAAATAGVVQHEAMAFAYVLAAALSAAAALLLPRTLAPRT